MISQLQSYIHLTTTHISKTQNCNPSAIIVRIFVFTQTKQVIANQYKNNQTVCDGEIESATLEVVMNPLNILLLLDIQINSQ